MLAFVPGELSTIIGPVDGRFSSSRAFDPDDLPCPPKSIMVSLLNEIGDEKFNDSVMTV